jgi:hypothetical protein
MIQNEDKITNKRLHRRRGAAGFSIEASLAATR